MKASRRRFLQFASGVAASSTGISKVIASEKEDLSPPPLRDPKSYLKKIYAPTRQTHTQETQLKIKGKLPTEIKGSFLRNGPNPYFNDFSTHHWFDGDGFLFKVRLNNGRAYLQSNFIQTDALSLEQKYNRKLYIGLLEKAKVGAQMGKTLWNWALNAESFFDSKEKSRFNFPPDSIKYSKAMIQNSINGGIDLVKDTSNTDLIYYNNQIVSLWWLSGKPYAIDPQTLETIGQETLNNTYTGNMSAHARVDKNTNELFFLDFNQAPISPFVAVNCATPEGLQWRRTFELENPRVYHDILYTENYVVLLDFPVGYTKNPSDGKQIIRLDKEQQSRIVFISRQNPDEMKTFYIDPTYVLHGINAYEQDNKITLSVCKFTDPFVTKENYNESIPRVGALRVKTVTCIWEFDLITHLFKETQIDDQNTEFPRINEALLGQKNRYSFSPKLNPGPDVSFSGIIKYDLFTQDFVTLNFGKNKVGEEAVFIPRTNAQSEDDGWLATLVHDLESNRNSFNVYDAKSCDAQAVAEIEIPTRIPHGFHSKWIEEIY